MAFELVFAGSSTVVEQQMPATFKALCTSPDTQFSLFQNYLLIVQPRKCVNVVDFRTFDVLFTIADALVLTASIVGSSSLGIAWVTIVESTIATTYIIDTVKRTQIDKQTIRNPEGHFFSTSIAAYPDGSFFVTAKVKDCDPQRPLYTVLRARSHIEAHLKKKHGGLQPVDGLIRLTNEPQLRLVDDYKTFLCVEGKNVHVRSPVHDFKTTLPFAPESFVSLARDYLSFYNQNVLQTYRISDNNLQKYLSNMIVDTCFRTCVSYRGVLAIVGTLPKTFTVFEAVTQRASPLDSLQTRCARVLHQCGAFKANTEQNPCVNVTQHITDLDLLPQQHLQDLEDFTLGHYGSLMSLLDSTSSPRPTANGSVLFSQPIASKLIDDDEREQGDMMGKFSTMAIDCTKNVTTVFVNKSEAEFRRLSLDNVNELLFEHP